MDSARCPLSLPTTGGVSTASRISTAVNIPLSATNDGMPHVAAHDCEKRRQKPTRSSRSETSTTLSGAVLINIPTLKRWRLPQATTVAIACAAGVYAFLFRRLSGREATRGKIGVAPIDCSNTQRQKRRDERRDDGERALAACHGQIPFRSKRVR